MNQHDKIRSMTLLFLLAAFVFIQSEAKADPQTSSPIGKFSQLPTGEENVCRCIEMFANQIHVLNGSCSGLLPANQLTKEPISDLLQKTLAAAQMNDFESGKKISQHAYQVLAWQMPDAYRRFFPAPPTNWTSCSLNSPIDIAVQGLAGNKAHQSNLSASVDTTSWYTTISQAYSTNQDLVIIALWFPSQYNPQSVELTGGVEDNIKGYRAYYRDAANQPPPLKGQNILTIAINDSLVQIASKTASKETLEQFANGIDFKALEPAIAITDDKLKTISPPLISDDQARPPNIETSEALLQQAQEGIKNGNYRQALYAVKLAQLSLSIEQSELINALLPDAPFWWDILKPRAGENYLSTLTQRIYKNNNATVNISISMVNPWQPASEAHGAEEENIKGYKAFYRDIRTPTDWNGEVLEHHELTMRVNHLDISITSRDEPKETLKKFANLLDFDKLQSIK